MNLLTLSYRTHELHKKVALTISRGKASSSCSVIIKLENQGVVGLGEAAEFDIPGHEEKLDRILQDLEAAKSIVADLDPMQRVVVEQALKQTNIGNSVRNAIDMALYDWAGKKLGVPVWKLLGLSPTPRAPISVTVGINSPDAAIDRLKAWQALGNIRGVKVKLGSPHGIDADKNMLDAIRTQVSDNVYIGIDANGGWNLEQAVAMSGWLKERSVVHMEQPLAPEDHASFPELFHRSSLPIFLDESCCSAQDVQRFSGCCHGVNIKLTKCGGLTEALRMIAVAQSLGLSTMVGCYGNTCLGNAAAHHLASMIDFIDLDSHLNLLDDPTSGMEFYDGYLVNSQKPGLGIDYDER
ncbi:mandelate racemase/muconate lactonizing enzyme family protein [Pirellulaceae bacterium SH449]